MNARVRGAQRRAGGIHLSAHGGRAPAENSHRWRTTLSGVIAVTMALGGLTVLTAAPAAADEVAIEQTATDAQQPAGEPPAAEQPASPAEEALPPTDEAAPPAEEAAPPAEDAAPPAEDAAPPAEQSAGGEIQLLLAPPGEDVVDKVEICHATSSHKNPYVINEPAADGDVSGHAGHIGPVFYPEIPKHTTWGDIIPPFYYEDAEGIEYFPGLNWDEEGQAIYRNDCNLPEPPAPPTMSVEATDCVAYIAPSLTVWLYGLRSNLDYRVIVSNQDGIVDTGVVPEGTEGDGSFSWDDLPGGTYTVTFEQAIIAGEWEVVDTEEFSVIDCPVLGVTANATACSNGDDGTAVVNLTGLIPGEEYSWTLTHAEDVTTGTLYDEVVSDALAVPFGDLPPGDYVFEVSWQSDEEHVVSADATFTVAACPVTPPTPPKPAALAATGADGTGGPLAAALVMIVLGAGVLVLRGRRPVGTRGSD